MPYIARHRLIALPARNIRAVRHLGKLGDSPVELPGFRVQEIELGIDRGAPGLSGL
jgi:hypothetical protein